MWMLTKCIVWHSIEIISILNINDPSRLKVLPMSDDIIFVLQIDSSLHCAVENVDILDFRQTKSCNSLKYQLRSLSSPVSWAKATCKQRKDSILCHWIQIPPLIWSDKKFTLGWWLLSLSQHLLLKVSTKNYVLFRVSKKSRQQPSTDIIQLL